MAAKLAGAGAGRFAISQNAEINVTPFVDVMLVLLIIFMVAAPMATVSIPVDLPRAEAPRTVQPPRLTIVSLQQGGAVYIGDTQTSLEALPSALPASMRANGIVGLPQAQRIVVRADAEVKYEQFMGVVNALQDGGFHKIDLMAEDIE
ncbi:MAG: biopolymer transporter ExbD [Caulobacter sp.]|nr:biopolymer transporter ExbD [Caulobacter sp.]